MKLLSLAIITAFAGCNNAYSADYAVGTGFISKHESKGNLVNGNRYNETNYGLSIERTVDRHHTTVGYYRNSVNRDTVYLAQSYTIYKRGNWSVMPTVGLFTGYSKPVLPGALLGVEYSFKRFAIQGIIVPPIPDQVHAVIAVGLKFKF